MNLISPGILLTDQDCSYCNHPGLNHNIKETNNPAYSAIVIYNFGH